MIIFNKQEDLSKYIAGRKNAGKTMGFVPTMGALHKGHLSLIIEAGKNNDLNICSIFVNPTQFNNAEDLRNYPVTIEKDIEKLEASGCDVLFIPAVNEVYPPWWQKKHFELGAIEKVLEGHFRPGHFQGVCQVIDRFLDIIQPSRLYLGQKDFQQCMVIRKLLNITERKVELVIVPTVREQDGLAMSSRNLRLNEKQRQQAPVIFKTISAVSNQLNHENFDELKTEARKNLETQGFIVDYVEIANVEDLSPAGNNKQNLVILVAASLGEIRLIDNIMLN